MISYDFIIFVCLVAVFGGATTNFFLVVVAGQEVPPASPCPEVFQYQTKSDGTVYGRVRIPYDGSSNLQLGVNGSMKGLYTNSNRVKLQIKMITPGNDLIQRTAQTVNYDVYFPFQNAIPKITRIEYNRRTYCTGPPEELVAPGVTTIWSGHNYYFEAPNRPESSGFAPSMPDQSIVPDAHQSFNDRDFEVPITPRAPANRKLECGISKSSAVPLISGGSDISDDRFPWLAAMFTATGNGYQYKCTGNLVSDKHIVTAGRCVSYFKTQVVQTEDILFILGKSNLRNWAISGAVTRGASAVRTNPDFNPNSGHADVSVITLDKPVEFSPSIAPICLWEGDSAVDDIVNKTGTVAGWGADQGDQKSNKFSVAVAKSVDMPVVSPDSCISTNFKYLQISDMTFCAGKRDGTGTCIGDSGAGFMMNKNGKFYLRGLASLILTDKDKCDLSNYMVFCDAAKLTDWIKHTMATNN